MKKIIALVLVLAMALTLAACGGSGSKETKVSVFWYEESDVYLSSVRTALNKELDALGVAYDNQYAGNDQSKQLDQIKTAIAGGANPLALPTPRRISWLPQVTSPSSSSTVPSAPTAPMSAC